MGTWVANIYLRHAYLCAKHAALIADATGGRMVLGLGVSHQPLNSALGIDMASPIDALRRYTNEVAGWLRGEGPGDCTCRSSLRFIRCHFTWVQ